MVQRFLKWMRSPARMSMSFDDRAYRLGEAVDLTVELRARKDLQIIEGRLDLVVEKRYAEQQTRMVATRESRIVTRGPKTHLHPRVEILEHHEQFVHSTAVFVKNGQVLSGKTVQWNPRLNIGSKPHPSAVIGLFTWYLLAALRVPDGDEIKHAMEITVEQDGS